IGKERMGGAAGLAAAMLYLSSPIVLAQSVNAFYLLQFAPLPLFFALRAFLARRFGAFALWTLIALSLREDVAVTFGAFALIALARRYPWRWALFGAGVPVVWWMVCTMVIQPA